MVLTLDIDLERFWWSFKARQDLEWSEAGNSDREDDVTEGVNEKMQLNEYRVGGMKEVEREEQTPKRPESRVWG